MLLFVSVCTYFETTRNFDDCKSAIQQLQSKIQPADADFFSHVKVELDLVFAVSLPETNAKHFDNDYFVIYSAAVGKRTKTIYPDERPSFLPLLMQYPST